MHTFRKIIREKPLLGSLIVTVLCFLCNELFSLVYRLLPDGIVFDYINELIFILWPILLVYVCGYMDIFRRRGLRRALKAGLLLFLIYGGYLAAAVKTAMFEPKMPLLPRSEIILTIFMLIGIGIREEVIFRGIIVNLYADKHFSNRKGLFYTAVSASFFFSIIHMGNLSSGIRLESVLVQVLVAWAMGMVDCAIYMRSGSIWASIILHSMVDCVGMFDGLFYQSEGAAIAVVNSLSWANLIPVVWFVPLALFLLRKKKAQEIIERNQMSSKGI